VVTGKPSGSAPCGSRYGNDHDIVRHPERAPLQAHAEFANGVRWAICGASPDGSAAILNIRSTDGGKTWTVADTGFGISPHHAGDFFKVHLATNDVGGMFLHGSVGGFDLIYVTSNGGRTWRLVCANEGDDDEPSEKVGERRPWEPTRRCASKWSALKSLWQ
jgi:photosystem II stability/assembly factor-like uncharacterized protein